MTDLNHIALFAKVVEAGSFSAAGRALRIPKATVSRQIAQLEQSLGARLLQRTTRKVELTALGRRYHEEIVVGLSSFEAAEMRLAASKTEAVGTLRITAPVGFGTRTLIGWIAEFTKRFDKVHIELRLTDEAVDPIDERVDLSFRTGPLPDSSLIRRKLGSTRIVLMASPAYLERHGVPECLEDLRAHDCILFGSTQDNDVWRLQGPDGLREVSVRGRISVQGSYAEIHAAIAGLGIALLPQALTTDLVRAGGLKVVLQDYGIEGSSLSVLYPSNRNMTAALQAFLDFVTAKSRSFTESSVADQSA